MFKIKIWRGGNINHSNLHSVRDISVFCRFLCHIINSYLLNFSPSSIHIINLRKIFFRNNKLPLLVGCVGFSRIQAGDSLNYSLWGLITRFIIHTISYSSIGCTDILAKFLLRIKRNDVRYSFNNSNFSTRFAWNTGFSILTVRTIFAIRTSQKLPKITQRGFTTIPIQRRIMGIFHFRPSIITTGLNTLYPQFISALSVSTILSIATILSIGTIFSISTVLSISTVFAINTIFTICTNTGIFPINIPVSISTDHYLWRSSIFTYRSLSGIFPIDYPVSIFSNCNSRCCSRNSFFTSGGSSCIYPINQPVTIIPNRNNRWNSIFTISSVPALCAYSSVLITNPPIHIISDMRCLAILTTRSCQIIPKISKIILRYGPFTSRTVRII